MSKADAHAFAARWERWREAEREELRRTPMAVKFDQLSALVLSALSLGWTAGAEDEDAEVRATWSRLRKARHG